MSGMHIPAYMQNRAGARSVSQSLAQGINAAQPPRISIRGGRFSKVDAAGNEQPIVLQFTDPQGRPVQQHATELEVIVVGTNQNLSKVYFEGAYNPAGDTGQPPTCFSDNGIAPSVQAAHPQAGTCASCPKGTWGSRVNEQTGQQSKACSDRKKLAVILPSYFQDDTLYQLQIPPASLKNIQALMFWLGGQDFGGSKADVTDIVTKISFEPGVTGILKFDASGFYDDATYQRVENLLTNGQDKIDLICGSRDVPRTAGAIAAPAPVQQIAYQPQLAPPAQSIQPQPVQVAYAPPGQGYTPGPVQAQPFQQPQFQQPAVQPQSPPQTPRKRRGRPAAGEAPLNPQMPQGTPAPVQFQPQPVPVSPGPVQPQPMQVTPAPASVGTPQFLQPQPAQQVAPAQQQFGMVSSPAAPDPGLTAQLASVFGMKTQ